MYREPPIHKRFSIRFLKNGITRTDVWEINTKQVINYNTLIQMEILEWIQNWFKDNCDGDWEKDEVIQITTLDTPGWEVEIDISKTSIANLEIKWILNEINRQDWYGVKVENSKFLAAGDAGKLIFLLDLFKQMIDKIENE